ncbi:thermonuclease family protein [Rubrivirga sp.]|uniref:thermonuclease family protein n=1 Tax=Rubrivirga sp. TaxID=1885344 RepID=UPI003C7174CE
MPVRSRETMHPEYRYRATVASVYDGDTFRADVDLGFSVWTKNVSFRMFGIDTPEIRGGTAATKAAGIAARDRLRELMPVGASILIDSTKAGKYGRYLADVFLDLEDGPLHVNQVLLDEGHAVPYLP